MGSSVDRSIPFHEEKEKKSKITSTLKSIFQVFKKFIDDEIWYMVRSILPGAVNKLVDALVMGGLMAFVYCQEGYEGLKDVIKAFRNKEAEQRKTRIVAGTLILASAGSGIGLAASLIANQIGAPVAGTIFMPVILPALMVVIYSLALTKYAYRLMVVRKKEQEEKAIYEEHLRDNQREMEQLKRNLEVLEQQRKSIRAQLDAYLLKKSENVPITEVEEKQHISNLVAQTHLEQNIKTHETKLKELEADNEVHRQRYLPYLETRLKAERKVAFAAVEVLTSSVILVSSILGASFIVGASVASFGTFAAALLITGVCIGGAIKLFEWVDKKYDHACTKWIRGLFSRSPKPQKTLANEKEDKLNLGDEFTPTQPIQIPGTTKEVLSAMPKKQTDRFLPSTPLPIGTQGIKLEKDINWNDDYPNFSPPNRMRNRLFNSKDEVSDESANLSITPTILNRQTGKSDLASQSTAIDNEPKEDRKVGPACNII